MIFTKTLFLLFILKRIKAISVPIKNSQSLEVKKQKSNIDELEKNESSFSIKGNENDKLPMK